MTDEQLKGALIEVRDYMLNQLPGEEWEYEFSSRFYGKLNRMIELERHPIWYYARRIVAAILLALGISGGLLLGFDEKVRADVARWIAEHFAKNEYRYQNEMGNEVDVSQYTLEGLVMEGYQLIQRKEGEDTLKEAYLGPNGQMLIFVVLSSTKEEELYVVFDQSVKKETVYVNGNKVDIYLSENAEESNIIAWQGPDGLLFSINGFMNKEQLIELAEKVNKIN